MQSEADEIAEAQIAQADAGARAGEKVAAAEAQAARATAEVAQLREAEAVLKSKLEVAEARAAALGEQSLLEAPTPSEVAAGGLALALGEGPESGGEEDAVGHAVSGGVRQSPRRNGSERSTAAAAAAAEYDPDDTAMFRCAEETNAAVLADMKKDMQRYRRQAGRTTLENWARNSER